MSINPPNRPPIALIYLAVFIAGASSMAIEMSASRLIGPYFGTSNVVWATVIGLTLVYLAVGYFVGGRWADRHPDPVRLFQIAGWAAFFSGLSPAVAHVILPIIARQNVPLGVGTFASILLLFAVPVSLMGCISPFAVRLALSDIASAGRRIGRIYAISTVGSILGTLLPVLLLLPELGTLATFMIVAGLLAGTALLALWQISRSAALRLSWLPVALLVLWFLG